MTRVPVSSTIPTISCHMAIPCTHAERFRNLYAGRWCRCFRGARAQSHHEVFPTVEAVFRQGRISLVQDMYKQACLHISGPARLSQAAPKLRYGQPMRAHYIKSSVPEEYLQMRFPKKRCKSTKKIKDTAPKGYTVKNLISYRLKRR